MGLLKTIPWKIFTQNGYKEVFRKGIKDVVDSKHITERFIRREGVTLEGFGTPMTFWKLDTTGDKCFCFEDNVPDKRHELCHGTGYLNGYQKYGYKTYTFASSSTNIILDNVYKTRDKKRLMLKTGSIGYIETDWIDLTNNKEYVFFESKEETSSNNSVIYEYSFDGNIWNMIIDISLLPLNQPKIKLRSVLSRAGTARKPSVHYFRFRFRNKEILEKVNIKFPNIDLPAVLASKSQTTRVLTGTKQGIVTTMPIRFLALSDMHLEGKDVCMFIEGLYKDKRFRAENIVESTYGEKQILLHVEFDVHFIRDEEDVFGIAYSLK